jgi:hypothetical protein
VVHQARYPFLIFTRPEAASAVRVCKAKFYYYVCLYGRLPVQYDAKCMRYRAKRRTRNSILYTRDALKSIKRGHVEALSSHWTAVEGLVVRWVDAWWRDPLRAAEEASR